MFPDLRVDAMSAASLGLYSRCRMWSGDFIFYENRKIGWLTSGAPSFDWMIFNKLFLSGRNDIAVLDRSFFPSHIWRRFIDRRPENAELLDRLHELGKIHRL